MNFALAEDECCETAPSADADNPNILKERALLLSTEVPLGLKTSYDNRPERKFGTDGGHQRAGTKIVGS